MGIDPFAVLRASIYNLAFEPARRHGASTLTQQIYTGALRRRSRYQPTIVYKIRQSLWALGATIVGTKAAVLKSYSESVYFGKSLYGISDAANFYCGKTVAIDRLTVAEGFFLAERIARPNAVSIPRLRALMARPPIARLLESDPAAPKQLVDLYEEHFQCGKEIEPCLARHLKKPVAHTCLSSVAALSEP
jgi:membrane peptidoglycan carboxypeptidase